MGECLLGALQSPAKLPGMRNHPNWQNAGISLPSDGAALWCWLQGSDPGAVLHRVRQLAKVLEKYFVLRRFTDGFRFGTGQDLTGYEDGTENPQGEAAIAAALIAESDNEASGLCGSSFVAVQKWQHDIEHFFSRSQQERDHTIGRRLSDNQEIDQAPKTAHVKRTAQESFEPEAFVLRRSMPWADSSGEGLMFVAFGHSFDAFEAQLGRMLGREDGQLDGLFSFTHPVTGGYYWCPPITSDGKLDLSMLFK